MTASEGIGAIRAAASLLLEQAALVPREPWHCKEVIGRVAVCDTPGRVIAWAPGVAGAGAAKYIAFRDPGGARLEAALLNMIADGAGHFLKLVPDAMTGDLAERVPGYTAALELALHTLEAAT
jgi:hypothetical protein